MNWQWQYIHILNLNRKLRWWKCCYQLMFSMSRVFKKTFHKMSLLNQMKWRIQAGVEVSDCKGPTVWRRHKPLRAAQTAAGRGWRWPTRCSLHPAWSQRLPLRLEHNTTSETIQSDGGERDGRAQQGRWLSEGGKHKWVLLTITSTQTLGWTNAHSDSGRQMFTDRHGTHKEGDV